MTTLHVIPVVRNVRMTETNAEVIEHGFVLVKDSEVCFGVVKLCGILCDCVVAFHTHFVISMCHKLKTIFHTLFRMCVDSCNLCLRFVVGSIISKHLTIFNADGVKLAIHVIHLSTWPIYIIWLPVGEMVDSPQTGLSHFVPSCKSPSPSPSFALGL